MKKFLIVFIFLFLATAARATEVYSIMISKWHPHVSGESSVEFQEGWFASYGDCFRVAKMKRDIHITQRNRKYKHQEPDQTHVFYTCVDFQLNDRGEKKFSTK